jgi:hypothetical protein
MTTEDKNRSTALADLGDEFDATGTSANNGPTIAIALRLLRASRHPRDDQPRKIGQISGGPVSLHGHAMDAHVTCETILKIARKR